MIENLGFMWFFKAGLGVGAGLAIVKGISIVGLAVLYEIADLIERR